MGKNRTKEQARLAQQQWRKGQRETNTEKFHANEARIQKERRERRRSEGLCILCPNASIPQKLYCQSCVDKKNIDRKAWRLERKLAGVCVECEGPTFNGFILCEKHHQIMLDRTSKLKAKRREEGVCYRCGKQKVKEEASVCEVCFIKSLSEAIWNTCSRWEELLELLEKQNRICVYSKRLIIPEVNGSVDHKIPRSKGGTNDIDNLQWTDFNVNRMKWDMGIDEFISLCKDIAANN